MSVRDIVLAAAGQGGGDKLYVDDVFSTYLYTGNGSTQTITNGIDLAGEGGLVWLKVRSTTDSHYLFDTVRGISNYLTSDSTFQQFSAPSVIPSVSSTGFSLGNTGLNNSSSTYASWTFRKAPKFFDVVTYTGDGVAGRTVAHNLGSVPGMIIIKRTDASSNWPVYRNIGGVANTLYLNATNATDVQTSRFPSLATSSVFYVGNDDSVNLSGGTYVAYLFAHDAGGFGETGDDSIVSCGSYTGGSAGNTITLGYEPQFLLIKEITDGGTGWLMLDVMRGIPVSTTSRVLYPNTSDAEATWPAVSPTATGFTLRDTDTWINGTSRTYIYLAIRRPNKPPESGTEVFETDVGKSSSTTPTYDAPFVVDMGFSRRPENTESMRVYSRLTGTKYLTTADTNAEGTDSWGLFDSNLGWYTNAGTNYRSWMFRRAPGFFDVVCYTGTGVARTVPHNLTVAPEMMIVKRRDGDVPTNWNIYSSTLGNASGLYLQETSASFGTTNWNNTTPTSAVFSLNDNSGVNFSGGTYVAYLFATLPGISKVGSYTGTGTTQAINCGFTTGARFVMIKRTDSTGDWYVWDTARGIVSGDDPYLLLNSTAAEVTNTDYIDPLASGFEISSTAPAAINASGGSFIFLAIA